MIEELCARYGWTIETVRDMPLARALAIQVAARVREGWVWREPPYIDRDQG